MYAEVTLISAIRRGDHAAFETAYRCWHQRAYYFFLKKTNSCSETKDLVQRSFIKLWQYRDTLSEQHAFEVQLFTIARSVWIDQLRKNAHERNANRFVAVNAEREDAGSCSTAFESNDQLAAALDSLPPMRRKVFELNRLQGYSYKEIAQRLHISVKTVDNHLSQAVKQLRSLFMLLMLAILLS
jgi:RNA polymerase sigma-70 factor (ECF subfamily)